MIKNSKLYDILKFVALVFLPAGASLYFGLSQVWGIPDGGEVVGTVTIIDTFLGALLHINSAAYHNSDAQYDGSVDVTEDEDSKNFMLNLHGDPNELDKQKYIKLKVNPPKKKAKKKQKA